MLKNRFLAPLSLALLSLAPLSAAEPLSIVQEGGSLHFLNVMSHLEVGAAGLTYLEQDSIWMTLAALMDETLAKLPPAARGGLPEAFSAKAFLKVAGMDRLKAVGTSLRRRADGMNHMLSFAAMPEGRVGLLTLSGGEPEAFLLHSYAPRDADLVLEFPLHTQEAAKPLLEAIKGMLSETERGLLTARLSAPLPPLGLSIEGLLERLASRVALIVRLNPNQELPAGMPGLTLPGVDAALIIERAGWLLKPVKQQMLPALTQSGLPLTVKDANGVLTLSFQGPLGPPPTDYQPTLLYNEASDRLIVATRPTMLAALLNSADKLVKTPEFEAAWQGLPATGNSAAYISPRLQKTVLDFIPKAMAASSKSSADVDTLVPLLRWVEPYLAKPLCLTQSNLPDGSLTAANSSFAIGDPSALGSLTAISVLASLAVPTFNVIQDMAHQTEACNMGRQTIMALKIYANDAGKGGYPKKLDALVTAKILPGPEILSTKHPLTKQALPWLYDSTLFSSSAADAIVLATPFTYRGKNGGKRVIVLNDGSATVIHEAEFQKRRKETLR
jgi:hypothetical protein